MGLALLAAGLAIGALIWQEGRHKRSPVSVFAEDTSATIFLFDGETLIDSTPSARALLAAVPGQGSAWARLMGFLTPQFADLEARFVQLPFDGALTLASAPARGQPLLLQAEMRGGLTRVVLSDPTRDTGQGGQDMMAQRAMQEEIDLLRATITHAPVLMWKERANGDVIWANGAYMLRAAEVLAANQDLTWPLPRLFDTTDAALADKQPRKKIERQDGTSAWFEISAVAEGEERLCFARSIDTLVQAETSLRDFMVTLTKTFAHLHVGLAIFDQHRQLVLFNPALMDLTGLPADFLTMRPSLVSVLDGMRDRNMIPEPKDYRGWRRQLTEMERAAASGLYEETWSLPGGQTYRVIGRPHPNGALALMFEDISSEMLRTRRFRADLEISQSVMDQIDEAIAVFSPAGQLVMSNEAYARLWGVDPAANLAEATLRSLSTAWRERCAPTSVWADLEEFAAQTGERHMWTADLRLMDGRMVEGRFVPLAGGATMTGFRLRDGAAGPKALFFKDSALKRA